MIIGAHSIIYSKSPGHELYFMCADVAAFVAAMEKRNVRCSPVQNQGWGMLPQVTLPGGGKLGVYQPRHARPRAMSLVSKPKAWPKKAAAAPARKKATAKRATAQKAQKKATRR